MNAMQNFLEQILLLHVIVCAVFLGFKTENPGWLVITLMNGRHNFFGTNLVIACYCMCCFSGF